MKIVQDLSCSFLVIKCKELCKTSALFVGKTCNIYVIIMILKYYFMDKFGSAAFNILCCLFVSLFVCWLVGLFVCLFGRWVGWLVG